MHREKNGGVGGGMGAAARRVAVVGGWCGWAAPRRGPERPGCSQPGWARTGRSGLTSMWRVRCLISSLDMAMISSSSSSLSSPQMSAEFISSGVAGVAMVAGAAGRGPLEDDIDRGLSDPNGLGGAKKLY